jgi:hypothetical protein
VVPIGTGQLKLRHDGASGRFSVRTHLFGGGSEEGDATLTDGFLKVNFTEKTSSGKPIEWIGIDLTSR